MTKIILKINFAPNAKLLLKKKKLKNATCVTKIFNTFKDIFIVLALRIKGNVITVKGNHTNFKILKYSIFQKNIFLFKIFNNVFI